MLEAEHQDQGFYSRLYLVVKGEIAIFTDHEKSCLRLLAPDLPEHAYVAGPWLGETQIPTGRKLELVGVKAGSSTPADYADMFLRLPNPIAQPNLARFEITVPFPKEILPGAEQDVSHMKVTILSSDGATQSIPEMKRLCLIAILVYDREGNGEPFLLDRESGRKWLCGGKIFPYRSLHVCAAGETKSEENNDDHARLAFRRAAELLGVNAVIDFGGGGLITPAIPPPGLSLLEANLSYFETLELRQALGEILAGGPGRIPDIAPIHFHGGNCGPVAS